jgi:Leucine-rich repeat (LRR) protein
LSKHFKYTKFPQHYLIQRGGWQYPKREVEDFLENNKLECHFKKFSEDEINDVFSEISKMTWLKRLWIQGLRAPLPKSTGNLTELKSLTFRYTKFESLPESIGNFTELEYMLVSYTKLKSLPESIGNLTKLKYLYLHNNELESLPDSIYNLTELINLSLSENKLKSLPNNIGNFAKLRWTDENFPNPGKVLYRNKMAEIRATRRHIKRYRKIFR